MTDIAMVAISNTTESLAKILDQYGPWALCVVLLIAIYWMFKYFMNLLEKRNTQFADILTETTAALQQAKETNDRLLREIDRLQRRLDNQN